jgi:hypothetical protein
MQKLFVLFVLVSLAAVPVGVPGQSGLWGSRDAYLGQRPVSDTPRIFALGLLAQKDTFALDRVAFSGDGREFYYPTNNTWFSSVNGKSLYFSTYDICTLRMAAGDTAIESLGPPINTPGFVGDFYVARDESYIIVSAKETKTYECELDISFHGPDGTWTAPVSLGPLINDGVAHRWGEYVSPDEKYLFYSRGDESEGLSCVLGAVGSVVGKVEGRGDGGRAELKEWRVKNRVEGREGRLKLRGEGLKKKWVIEWVSGLSGVRGGGRGLRFIKISEGACGKRFGEHLYGN